MRLNLFQREWLKALKSGKFKQGKKQLAKRTKNKKVKYCCLGVACVVAKRLGIKLSKEISGEDISFNGCKTLLPDSVVDKLKLRGDDGDFLLWNSVCKNAGKVRSLADANDKGCSHLEIAEYIESNPSNVFTNV